MIFINTPGSRNGKFKCFKCGKCCCKLGLPWDPVRVEDTILAIANFLEQTPDEVIKKYYGEIVYLNGEKNVKVEVEKTTPCPFLSSDNKCTIYPVRPEGCRIYPLEKTLGTQGVDCPGYKV